MSKCIYRGAVTVKAQLISGNVPHQQHTIQSHGSNSDFFSLFFHKCVGFNLKTANKWIYKDYIKYSTCPALCQAGLRSARADELYILNTPKRVFFIGAFSAALRLSPNTRRVSAGSIMPSSHSLALE